MHTHSQPYAAGKFFAALIFFLRYLRTEVPQCSGQACFDEEREGGRREEIHRGKKLVSKERWGETGIIVELRKDKEETEREGMKMNATSLTGF